MINQQIRPSRVWYAVAAGLLAGVMVCVVIGVLAFVSAFQQLEQLQRVEAPGRGEVVFSEPGQYTLYVEGSYVASYIPADLPEVTIRPQDGGPPVTIEGHNLGSTYTINGQEGREAGTFRIDRPGAYELRAGTPNLPDITGVAVGKSNDLAFAVGLIVLLGGIFLLGPSALVVALVTYVRRDNARRALRTPAWPALPVPWPYYPWPPPAPSPWPAYPPAGPGPTPAAPVPPAGQPDQTPYEDRRPEP
jgi:hypothetical protein